MTIKLYLMRHGEAVGATEHVARPLSEKGVQEARKVGKFLAQNKVNLGQIYHSGKLRAEQTAKELVSYFTPSLPVLSVKGLLPNDDPEMFATGCCYLEQETLVVGHLPFLLNLASQLLFKRQDLAWMLFDTGALLCLEKQQADWVMAWFMPPSLL